MFSIRSDPRLYNRRPDQNRRKTAADVVHLCTFCISNLKDLYDEVNRGYLIAYDTSRVGEGTITTMEMQCTLLLCISV
jgi:hypothetical protein